MRTPVAFIIFNRPDTTARVFAEITRARPRTLFVIADGPRPGQPRDAENCAATRAIIDRIDWKCEVLKNYSDVNLGCGRRPATGLSWVFDQVEEAIILEDDCLPHPTFFRFCEELLDKYRNDERVMHISGDNFLLRKRRTFSYFFSHYCLSWGWATWRRAFQHYDPGLKQWPAFRDTSWLFDIVGEPKAIQHWNKIFDRAYAAAGGADYWDFQWLFAIWAHRAFSILPSVNLISNIGFREDATHTKGVKDSLANLPRREMVFPLEHPPRIARDPKTDQAILERALGASRPGFYQQLRGKFAGALPVPLRKSLLSLSSALISFRTARKSADHL